MSSQYGLQDGLPITPPFGWTILPIGRIIPPVHREFSSENGWLTPRTCRSTMTPVTAQVWGYVRAYAAPTFRRIRDLPALDRKPFTEAMLGQTCPIIEGLPDSAQDAFYDWDYIRWKEGWSPYV